MEECSLPSLRQTQTIDNHQNSNITLEVLNLQQWTIDTNEEIVRENSTI